MGNIHTDIIGELPYQTYKELEKKLSFRPQGYQFTPQFNRFIKDSNGKNVRRLWDGWKRQCWKNTKRIYFPTGLVSLAQTYLKDNGFEILIQDIRTKPGSNLDIQIADHLSHRNYQIEIIDISCERSRGIIQAATGSGKTLMAAGIIQRLNVSPFIFFVTSIDLLTQAKESLEDALRINGGPINVGQIGGGTIDIQDINVMTVQTAVRALGKKWDSKTRFDGEDTNDSTPIGQHRKEIQNLIHSTKGYICDECVVGDALIITKNGPVKMDQLYKYIGNEVLSFCNNSVVWKKITNFYRKGIKKTVKIVLSNGMNIKCTSDHSIMTKMGWLEAGKICQGNSILFCANAGVANKLNCDTELSNHLLNTEQKNTESLSTATTNDRTVGILNYQSQNSRQYLEHYSEILDYLSHPNAAKTHDYAATTACRNLIGLNLNRHISTDYLHNIGNMRMEALETKRISARMPETELFPRLENSYHSACYTNYATVESVIHCNEEPVFDITVEDTHCFFANGILVHNCQHWRAETCQMVCKAMPEAYFAFGMSATPYRDEGDDLMIKACFGRKIGEITASRLIKEGWLVRPDIKMIHVKGPTSPFKQWQSIYKNEVVENEKYNSYVANISNAYIKEDRLVLVLVQQIKHGKTLESMIDGSVFLSGNSTKKKREDGIKSLRNKEISCIISSTIFDEGIDVRPLDTVVLAGQGKSRVRAMQRIGRVLRPYEDELGKKTKATVIDFCIHQKYLQKHAIEREKMYRTEPEYHVEDINP